MSFADPPPAVDADVSSPAGAPAGSAGPRGRLGRRRFLGAAAAATGALALAPLQAVPAAADPGNGQGKGVGRSGAPASSSDLPPNAVSLVKVTDSDVNRAVGRLEAVIKDLQKRSGVPGLATAVVYQGKVVFQKAFGVRDLTTNQPTTVDTVFQLASVSKSLAGTVVARLVADKTVDWTDPIQSHIPEFTLRDPYVGSHVTIEDMMSHRSGLPGAAGDLLEDLGLGREYIVEHLRYEPLAPLRTRYAYSNFGFTTGAVAAAAATDKGNAKGWTGGQWADVAEQELFTPLGMTSTSYRHADFVARPNRSAMHVRVGDVWKQLYVRNADQEAPAGGASSSVRDLSSWLRLQLAAGTWNGKPFVDPAALGHTHQPHIPTGEVSTHVPYARSSFYGLGFDLSDDAAGRVRWSHSGAFLQGVSTQVLLLPSADLGIVTLTNGMPVGLPEAIGATFLDLVEAGTPQRDWLAAYGGLIAGLYTNDSSLANALAPLQPTQAHPDGSYVGDYTNDFYGRVRVVSSGGSLHLLIGPQPNDYPLTLWDGDVFAYYPTGENAVGITSARFSGAAGGQATTLFLEYYNGGELDQNAEVNLGLFTRSG